MNKIISKVETGINFVSPKGVDEGEVMGIIFVLNEDDEIIGYVYHNFEADQWVLETVDFLSEGFDTFSELWDEVYDEGIEDNEFAKLIIKE